MVKTVQTPLLVVQEVEVQEVAQKVQQDKLLV